MSDCLQWAWAVVKYFSTSYSARGLTGREEDRPTLRIRLGRAIAALVIAAVIAGAAGCSRVPAARFTTSSLVGPAPLSVTFTNRSANSDTFEWDFGDGSKNEEKNPTHVYTKAGLFTVTLKAGKRGTSEISSSSATIKVEPGQLTNIVINPSTIQLLPEQTAHFDVKGFDSYGNEIGDVAFSYSATVGSFDSTGTFAAGTKAGTYPDAIEVQATKGQTVLRSSASVVILPDALAYVTISSTDAVVFTDTKQKFVASGFDRFGNAVSLTDISWEASISLGTIERDGTLTVGWHPGAYVDAIKVMVRQGDTTAKASANVLVRALGTFMAIPKAMEHAYVNIVEASITQVDDKNLRFDLRVNSLIPEQPSSDYLALIFGLDLNNNNMFNEFPPDLNLRVGFDYRFGWFGIIDGAPPAGGTSFKFPISGSSVTFLIPLELLGNPSQFNWQVSTLESTSQSKLPGDNTPPQVLYLD